MQGSQQLAKCDGMTATGYSIKRDDRRGLFAGWTNGPDSGELSVRFLTFGVVTTILPPLSGQPSASTADPDAVMPIGS